MTLSSHALHLKTTLGIGGSARNNTFFLHQNPDNVTITLPLNFSLVQYSEALQPLYSQIVMDSIIKVFVPMPEISMNSILVASDDGQCKILEWSDSQKEWIQRSNELDIGLDRVALGDAVHSVACFVTKDDRLGIVDISEGSRLRVRKLDSNSPHGIAAWMNSEGTRLLSVSEHSARLYTRDLELVHEIALSPPEGSARRGKQDPLLFSTCSSRHSGSLNGNLKRGYVAVIFGERVCRMFEYNDTEDRIHIGAEFVVSGHGTIRALRCESPNSTWIDSSSRSLHLYTWDKNGQMHISQRIDIPILYTDLIAMHDTGIFVGSDATLIHTSFHSKESVSRSFHELTCCGIDFDPSGKFIIAGDFLGNLILWNHSTKSPERQVKIANSAVRSIHWKTHTSRVYVGCLDGSVNMWDFGPSDSTPRRVLTCRGGVTALQWEHGEAPRRLAAVTTEGQLVIAEETRDDDGHFYFVILVAIHAHRPFSSTEVDPRFGSIRRYAEAWSVAWSPCGDYVATASEDQSVVIWNAQNGDRVHSFSGHSTAVTSIDWRSYGEQIGEFLVSTADDNRVMVWRRNSTASNIKTQWTLDKVFSLRNTITCSYLKLRRKSPMIIVVSTNGIMSLMDISAQRIVYRRKVHAGSIEGLQWNGNTDEIATVSSDCSINLMQYEEVSVGGTEEDGMLDEEQ